MSEQAARPRILVIEDEAHLRDATVRYLNMDGFTADGVGSLGAAEAWMGTHDFDIVVLDLGLPDGDGLEWLAARPALLEKGVIVASARGDDAERVAGIRTGADAYLVKPVRLEELASLAANLARRMRGAAAPPAAWALHPVRWTLESPQGVPVRLTPSETTLLRVLAGQPGATVPRHALVLALGEDPRVYDPRRMEILVRRLRNKVRESAGEPLPLETVHAVGYAFAATVRIVPS
jgi:DNA-binding response OmpR family regulator